MALPPAEDGTAEETPDPCLELAAVARELYRRGWMAGTAGNLSRRLADGSFWISASGKSKGNLTARDFLRLAADGELRERRNPADRPSAESSLHAAVYRLFSAAQVCYHVHTVAANLASRLTAGAELPLPPIEMLKGLGVWEEGPAVAVAVFPNHASVPAVAAAVEARFGAAPPRLPGFLIRDHGLTVWAADSQEALDRLELFEFVFRCMIGARGAGIAW